MWRIYLVVSLLTVCRRDHYISVKAFSANVSPSKLIHTSIGAKKISNGPIHSTLARQQQQQQQRLSSTSTCIGLAPITAAACASAASSIAPIPSLKAVSLACLLPTLIGYYKSEYGVSYAYGTATASVAFMVLRSLPTSSILPFPTSIAACHATAVFFYGVRLNLFLLYRELFVPRFKEMRERIEERAKERGSRLSRTPFVFGCALLYGCLSAPMLVTREICGTAPLTIPKGFGTSMGSTGLVLFATITTWLGFLLGAVGDLTKSYSKAKNGDNHLVTGGVFNVFRHPNYTGEAIAWTSSCIAAFVAVAFGGTTTGSSLNVWKHYLPHLAASLFGLIGITTVLSAATTNLEAKQKERYGSMQQYKDWVKGSWVGVCFSRPSQSNTAVSDTENSGINLDVKDEAEGTGI